MRGPLLRDQDDEDDGQDGEQGADHDQPDAVAELDVEILRVQALHQGQRAGDGVAHGLDAQERQGQAHDVVLGLDHLLLRHLLAGALLRRRAAPGRQVASHHGRELERDDQEHAGDDHGEEGRRRARLKPAGVLQGTAGADRGETCHVRQECRPTPHLLLPLVQLVLLLVHSDLHAVCIGVDALLRVLDFVLHGAHLLLVDLVVEARQHRVADDPLPLVQVHRVSLVSGPSYVHNGEAQQHQVDGRVGKVEQDLHPRTEGLGFDPDL
mmetsp:Transcript_75404/g.194402  ORF Transcript_75404/g.194402 Transcript_75404/m.194402 type:complete len:267 (+) Transcript_75404:613-1413(+)